MSMEIAAGFRGSLIIMAKDSENASCIDRRKHANKRRVDDFPMRFLPIPKEYMK